MKNEDAGRQAELQVCREAILAHFRDRPMRGFGQYPHDVVYHLVRFILEHHRFQSLESLVEYCKDHDNLHPWLVLEADRVLFSAELVQGLNDMASKTGDSPPSGSALE